MKLNFKDCTLKNLDKTFELKEVRQMPILMDWLQSEGEISDFERQILAHLQQKLLDNFHDWNEFELAMEFIGPLMAFVDFSEKEFNFFAQRSFGGKVAGIELSGKPDGMVAQGKREPEQPYFCFQEYKREQDPEGDPAGQVLAAMLVAQEINEHEHPIYGCYVKGNIWRFLVLQGKEYSISPSYVATREDILIIHNVLKALKPIIRKAIQT